jgi:hypothetical protein
MRFRSTFQRFLAQIRYSHPWKVLRKRILKGLQKVRPAVQNLRLGGVKMDSLLTPNGMLLVEFMTTKTECNCNPFVDKFMLPKRRFGTWKDEQKMKCGFRRKHFSTVRGPNWLLTPLKSTRKSAFHLLFILPKSSFWRVKFIFPDGARFPLSTAIAVFWAESPSAFAKHRLSGRRLHSDNRRVEHASKGQSGAMRRTYGRKSGKISVLCVVLEVGGVCIPNGAKSPLHMLVAKRCRVKSV